MNTTIRLALVGLLAAGLGLGIWKSFSSKTESDAVRTAAEQARAAEAARPQLQTVKLLTGSAKFNFLKDAELTQLLAAQGLQLELVKSGAFAADVGRDKEFDAVWPAGANAAADFAAAWKSGSTYPVFTTPLAIASWWPLMPVLSANGLASTQGAHGSFELAKALPLMTAGTRWNQLKGNTVFPVNKGFLVNTPDIRKSNTGVLYIGALAYIANGHEVPTDMGRAEKLAEQLSSLITRQGFQEGTLAGPFEDYIGQGMGKAPLVLIYESQFVEARRDGKLRDTQMLLYPKPGLQLKHILVARTDAGKKLGEVLANDPAAQKIAAKYGFRTNNPEVFAESMKSLGLDAPDILDVADSPAPKVLDAMTRTLINKLEGN